MRKTILSYHGQADFVVENFYSSIYIRFTDSTADLSIGNRED